MQIVCGVPSVDQLDAIWKTALYMFLMNGPLKVYVTKNSRLETACSYGIKLAQYYVTSSDLSRYLTVHHVILDKSLPVLRYFPGLIL